MPTITEYAVPAIKRRKTLLTIAAIPFVTVFLVLLIYIVIINPAVEFFVIVMTGWVGLTAIIFIGKIIQCNSMLKKLTK